MMKLASSLLIGTRLFLLGGGIVACSEGQNILGKAVTSQEKKGDIAYQLFQAEYLYDRGKFAKALSFAQSAHLLDPHNELASMLEGAIEFGLAGMDIFTLAKKLADQGTLQSNAKLSIAASSGSSSDPLAALSVIFGISADEISAMTLDGNRVTTADGKVVEGAPQSGIFKNYPLLLPKSAADARQSGGNTIQHLARAVMALCGVVGDEVKLLDPPDVDARDASEACRTTPYTLEEVGKSRFLWAMAHLVEALAFRSIVLYAPDGTTPNIEKRSTVMSGSLSISDYLQGITQLSAVLDVIFPVDPATSADSMLTAMVHDLETVDLAFSAMPGVPTSMTSSIKSAITQIKTQEAKINQTKNSASGGGTQAGAGAQALKEQMTSQLSANLRTQIAAKSAAGDFTPAQKTDACGAYKTISTMPLPACD